MDIALNKMEANENRMDSIENDTKHAFSRIYELKYKTTAIKQKEYLLAICIFGLPLSEEEKDATG